MSTTYLTVAIPFVNAAPHLGYAYELVQADIWARSRRAAGERVRFLGGTDDHSLKNVLAAEAAGVPTQQFVNDHAERFERLGDALHITLDDFIRTSVDERHRPAVERLWRACASRGDLYRRSYEAEYCVGCEQFYAEAELVDGACPEHRTRTEHVAEENWFFRLSAYQDHLDELISSGTLRIGPEPFRNEVLAFVRSGLDDISVSRSVERARGWGIPVPGDSSQVVYVWFDALANYISALGFADPASREYRTWWCEADRRVHVVGKGILRFHAVYWPAFLVSAGEPLPTELRVHPYLTVEGAKISKSGPHQVDPFRLAEDLGADALRWWFARDVGEFADTDFTIERLVERINQDLANGLGNLANRIVTLVHRLRGGVVPGAPADVVSETARVVDLVDVAIARFELRRAAALIVDAAAALNRDIEATRPWEARHTREELDRLLRRHVESVRHLAVAAAPIVPDLSDRLLTQLGRGSDRLPGPAPTFARLELT
jgi:methionyl-tRNA synthetase